MKYGLIANKVDHSFSAEIHKKIFGYDYELKAITENELHIFLERREFSAINVTIPYKESVIEHLDYVNQEALDIGAVNTIVNVDNKLYGYNTDVLGLTALIERNGIEIANKKVLVLGSGGTSKTACYVAKKLGCLEVYRVSRTARDGCIDYKKAILCHSDADVIINTTPSGMYPDIYSSAVDINEFKALSAVVDVVYNPLKTKLVCDAEKMGVKAVGGLYMLVAQAAYAAEKFVNKTVSVDKIDEVFKDIYTAKQNIVLIGMPRSGKTSSGKIIAEQMKKTFVDTDEEIFKKYGKYPHEIIIESGEKAFRDIESEVISEIASMQGCVIATGGGAILRAENIDALRMNGLICFLNRDIDSLTVSSDRPLSSSRDDLIKRYNERYDIYCNSCDIRIECVDGVDNNAQALIKEILNENSCN